MGGCRFGVRWQRTTTMRIHNKCVNFSLPGNEQQQQQRGKRNTLLQLLSCCPQSLPLLLLRLLPLQFNWIHLCQFTINKATKEIKQKEMKRKLHNSTTKTEGRSSSSGGTRPSSKLVIITTVPQYLLPFLPFSLSLCCQPPVSDKQTSGKATVKCFLINEGRTRCPNEGIIYNVAIKWAVIILSHFRSFFTFLCTHTQQIDKHRW